MRRLVAARRLVLLASVLVIGSASGRSSTADEARRAVRPNVVVILADDMGFSDPGCYGGEIATPNLDALAAGGLRFTQFYNTARCWPTRGALLTGYYPQAIRRDAVEGVRSGTAGTRPPWARLLPELLKPAGYHSYHAGKWHVDGTPVACGFEHSYWLEDSDRDFNPREHFEDDRPLPPVEPGSGYYATTAIVDHALAQLDRHQAEHAGEPFFQYVAFLSPHFPLMAPEADIARYRDRYTIGWEAVRTDRWKRIQAMRLFPESTRLSEVEPSIGPPYDNPEAMARLGAGEVNRPVPWSSLTDDQRAFQAAKMAVHAAMVDRIDEEIGRIVAKLKAMGTLEDTLILFLSDNGASAEIVVRGDGHDPEAAPGSAASFLCLGPGWSTVSNTPFRRHKAWTHEGGISTPLIAHWPRGIAARGELRANPGHVVDLVPTILEVAGASAPATWDGQPVPAPHGRSLVPVFTHDNAVARDALYFHHRGTRAIRQGDWKLVADVNGPWELYNLADDRTETTNLAPAQPDRVRTMAGAWSQLNDELSALARKNLPESERITPKKAATKKAAATRINP
jgi:arylsulfatase